MKKTILLSLTALFMLSSCYTNKVYVGTVKDSDKLENFDKSKQFYLFEGLIKLGNSQPRVPEDKNMLITSKFTFVDGLITVLTAGIVSSRTQKVEVPKTPKK